MPTTQQKFGMPKYARMTSTWWCLKFARYILRVGIFPEGLASSPPHCQCVVVRPTSKGWTNTSPKRTPLTHLWHSKKKVTGGEIIHGASTSQHSTSQFKTPTFIWRTLTWHVSSKQLQTSPKIPRKSLRLNFFRFGSTTPTQDASRRPHDFLTCSVNGESRSRNLHFSRWHRGVGAVDRGRSNLQYTPKV